MASRTPRKERPRRRAVLVVDREQAICDFIRAVLEDIGVTVSCAASGAAARALIRGRRRFRLAFIAIILPDEESEALAAAIAARGTPVVTGSAGIIGARV